MDNTYASGFFADVLLSIMSSLIQNNGPSSGVVFDPEDMRLLVQGDVLREAMDIFLQLRKYGIPDHMGPEWYLEYHAQGRCLMSIGVPIGFKLSSYTNMRSRTLGMIKTASFPGSDRVLDRASGRLVKCTREMCAHAIPMIRPDTGQEVLINKVAWAQTGSFVINKYAPVYRQAAAFKMLSTLMGPAGHMRLALSPDSLIGPLRESELEVDQWVDAGYERTNTVSFLDEYLKTFQSCNIFYELRFPGNFKFKDILTRFIMAVVQGNETHSAAEATFISATQDLIAINGGVGVMLPLYRKSLGLMDVPPPADAAQPKAGTGDSGGLGTVTVVLLSTLLPVACLLVTVIVYLLVRPPRAHRDLVPALAPGPGMVVLCVTDIQDSTTLWETLPADVCQAAIQLHHIAIRKCATLHHGYESATEGDSFILAFHNTVDCTRFALQVQKALLDADWPYELHTSEHASTQLVRCDASRADLHLWARRTCGPTLHTLLLPSFVCGVGAGKLRPQRLPQPSGPGIAATFNRRSSMSGALPFVVGGNPPTRMSVSGRLEQQMTFACSPNAALSVPLGQLGASWDGIEAPAGGTGAGAMEPCMTATSMTELQGEQQGLPMNVDWPPPPPAAVCQYEGGLSGPAPRRSRLGQPEQLHAEPRRRKPLEPPTLPDMSPPLVAAAAPWPSTMKAALTSVFRVRAANLRHVAPLPQPPALILGDDLTGYTECSKMSAGTTADGQGNSMYGLTPAAYCGSTISTDVGVLASVLAASAVRAGTAHGGVLGAAGLEGLQAAERNSDSSRGTAVSISGRIEQQVPYKSGQLDFIGRDLEEVPIPHVSEIGSLQALVAAVFPSAAEMGRSSTRTALTPIFRGLRVRVGYHSGVLAAAEVQLNRASQRIVYSGPVLQLAKAVSDAGRGGQITLSSAVMESLGSELIVAESGVVMYSGRHVLKQDEPAVDIYSLFGRSLVARAAYLSAPRSVHMTVPGALAAPLGSLVVAVAQLAEVASLLDSQLCAETAQPSDMATATVRCRAQELAVQFRGYMVPTGAGVLQAVFTCADAAVRWILTLQADLENARALGASGLFGSDDMATDVWSSSSLDLMLRGGVDIGTLQAGLATDGKVSYEGCAAKIASRLAGHADWRQVLTSFAVALEVLQQGDPQLATLSLALAQLSSVGAGGGPGAEGRTSAAGSRLRRGLASLAPLTASSARGAVFNSGSQRPSWSGRRSTMASGTSRELPRYESGCLTSIDGEAASNTASEPGQEQPLPTGPRPPHVPRRTPKRSVTDSVRIQAALRRQHHVVTPDTGPPASSHSRLAIADGCQSWSQMSPGSGSSGATSGLGGRLRALLLLQSSVHPSGAAAGAEAGGTFTNPDSGISERCVRGPLVAAASGGCSGSTGRVAMAAPAHHPSSHSPRMLLKSRPSLLRNLAHSHLDGARSVLGLGSLSATSREGQAGVDPYARVQPEADCSEAPSCGGPPPPPPPAPAAARWVPTRLPRPAAAEAAEDAPADMPYSPFARASAGPQRRMPCQSSDGRSFSGFRGLGDVRGGGVLEPSGGDAPSPLLTVSSSLPSAPCAGGCSGAAGSSPHGGAAGSSPPGRMPPATRVVGVSVMAKFQGRDSGARTAPAGSPPATSGQVGLDAPGRGPGSVAVAEATLASGYTAPVVRYAGPGGEACEPRAEEQDGCSQAAGPCGQSGEVSGFPSRLLFNELRLIRFKKQAVAVCEVRLG